MSCIGLLVVEAALCGCLSGSAGKSHGFAGRAVGLPTVSFEPRSISGKILVKGRSGQTSVARQKRVDRLGLQCFLPRPLGPQSTMFKVKNVATKCGSFGKQLS